MATSFWKVLLKKVFPVNTFQVGLQLEYQLFKLFHNENDIKRFMEELKDRNDNLSRAQTKREKVEEKMKGKKKEMGQLNRELAAIEKDMREKVRLKWTNKHLNQNQFIFHILSLYRSMGKAVQLNFLGVFLVFTSASAFTHFLDSKG